MRKKTGNKEVGILEAAIKLFARKGYYNTTVQDIAGEAGIGVGSVYSYYRSKDEILDTIFIRLWSDLIADIERISSSTISAGQKIEEHTDKLFELFFKNKNLALVYINEFNIIQHLNYSYLEYYSRYYELLANLFRAGVGAGIFRPGLDFEILKYFIIGGIRNIMIQYYANPAKFTAESIRSNIISLLKNGFIEL